MIVFLTSLPLWASGLLLVGLTTFISMCGPPLVRRYVPLEKLALNNEVAGFKFATVGVLYAVFLAFAIILVWEKFSDADSAVTKEAGAASAIYHLSEGVAGAPGAAIRIALANYLKRVVAEEWPAMDRGKENEPTHQALTALYGALLAADTDRARSGALMSQLYDQIDLLTQARRARLLAAEGSVPGIIWVVLFGGAVLTIAFAAFFGAKNLRSQSIMMGILSLMIFGELLIVVAIDRPFTGTIKVSPDALQEVLADHPS